MIRANSPGPRLAAGTSEQTRPLLLQPPLLSRLLPAPPAPSTQTPAPPGPPTAHRAHPPIQRQFAEKHHLVQLLAKKLSLAAHQPQGHRQIESRSFLSHICRRQIDRHALPVRKFKSAIPQCALNPLPALLRRNSGRDIVIDVAKYFMKRGAIIGPSNPQGLGHSPTQGFAPELPRVLGKYGVTLPDCDTPHGRSCSAEQLNP